MEFGASCSKSRKKILNYKLFLSSTLSHLTCPHIFNLLLNVILSKEKLSLNHQHEFCFLPYYCIIPVLHANMRTFKSHMESLKLRNSHFLACTQICILFLPERQKSPTIRTCLFLFPFGYMYVLPALSVLGLLMSEGGQNRRGQIGCPLAISFCSISCSVNQSDHTGK